MPSARSHGSAENRMCIGWPDSALIQPSRRKASQPSTSKSERVRERTLECNRCNCYRTFPSVFAIVNCMLRRLLLITLLLAAALCFAKDKSKDRFLPPGPIHVDKAGQKWIDKTLRKMSPEDKVGQLFSIWVRVQFLNDADPIFIQLRDNIRKYHIGSVVMSVPVDGAVLLKSQPDVAAELLNRLQRSSQLPLLVEADFERGVSMRLNGTTVFPHAMAFGATGNTEKAERFGRIPALKARAGGWLWMSPFKQAVYAGVDAVMVAHVTVPALDSEPNRVATTSRAIVTGLLKEDMGFKGLVVTDALDMAGLTRLYAKDIGRAAVESFKAGNDMLIIPANLDASYRSVLQAVQSGEISRQRLDQSVRKILELKASLGLNKARLVDPGKLSSEVAKPENLAAGQRIADEAITLVRDNGKVIPLQSLGASGTTEPALPYQSMTEVHNRLVAVIFSDDLRTDRSE